MTPLPDGAVVLSPSFVAVVNAADALLHEKGRATVREIAAAVGLRSPSGVHQHLTSARDLGLIDWTPGHPGTIHLTVERTDRTCCGR